METQKREFLLDIRQIPQPNNRQAVVIATCIDESGASQGIGISASLDLSVAYDPQAILDDACKKAQERLRAFQPISNSSQEKEDKCELSEVPVPSEKARSKSSRNHKTEPGSITDKQYDTLSKMATERNTNIGKLSQEHFGIEPAAMSSQQAQVLFDTFKNRRNR